MYTNDAATLKRPAPCRSSRHPVIIHLSGPGRNEDLGGEVRATPTAFLESLGFWGPRTLPRTPSRDARRHRDPRAPSRRRRAQSREHMKLASGIAPVEAMRQAAIAVGLGTDGAAVTMTSTCARRCASGLLHKLVASDPRAIPAPVALEMARSTALEPGHAEGNRVARSGQACRPDRRVDGVGTADSDVRPRVHIVYVNRGHDVRTTQCQRQGPDA